MHFDASFKQLRWAGGRHDRRLADFAGPANTLRAIACSDGRAIFALLGS
jgi:hypothetical protein